MRYWQRLVIHIWKRMYDGINTIQQNNTISGCFVRITILGELLHFQGHLMIGTGQGGKRDTTPASAYRSMHVTEKYMANIVICIDAINKRVLTFKTDVIQKGNTNIKWWMMHKQIDGL